ncbi:MULTISPECIES: cystathionine gamma-synthase [Gordonia]|uniref:Cystathionine gamma-synthase n=2 Tax=Gordonia TaxID=2053 RepID=L7LR41_9ACTN|nr:MULTISPECIES: cystathionine gamma-synthase [Gordonia]AUH69663.1 cystathionine gamma-synthase [Gordonia sp. YC-JH1]KJR09359.1 cystathionine gamma-synthase [Gordonia sihwensis]KXT57490.1 cystathionine gamma-synthase [Gordonia sp. QH-12]GAC62642.1 cystathionine gamma-synthase [Gordonia sihwensis NBRC 108236]
MSEQGFSTKAIHAGWDPDERTGAVNVPIYASSTFAQDGVGGMRDGFEYARTGNPTRRVLEANIAAIEAGRFGRGFASGMAATDALLRATLRPGDHLVIPNDAYGGTFRLIDKVFTEWGITYSVAPVVDVEAIRAAITPATKLVWVETPTNPLLNVGDIAAVAEVAHAAGAKLVVDNTFATPYLQQPLTLGADAVVHSTTKYLGGHSDVVGGAIVTNDEQLDSDIAFLQNGAGAVPGPFDAYLTMRGIKTLAVRMDRHCDNAEKLVEFFSAHPKIEKVLYPGLADHPGHAVAAKQMRRFGGMISVQLTGGREAALDFCARTKVFTLAESLGGIESLIEHPGAMTHASTAGSLLEVPDNLVRLSVGIEDADDLLEDVRQALA